MKFLLFLVLLFLSLLNQGKTQCSQPVILFSTGSGGYLSAGATINDPPILSSTVTTKTQFCMMKIGSTNSYNLLNVYFNAYLREEAQPNDNTGGGMVARPNILKFGTSLSGALQFHLHAADPLNTHIVSNSLYLQGDSWTMSARIILHEFLVGDSRLEWQIVYGSSWVRFPFTSVSSTLPGENGNMMCKPFSLMNRGTGRFLDYDASGVISFTPQNSHKQFCVMQDLDDPNDWVFAVFPETSPPKYLRVKSLTDNTLLIGIQAVDDVALEFYCSRDLYENFDYVFNHLIDDTQRDQTIQSNIAGTLMFLGIPIGNNNAYYSYEEWQAVDSGSKLITHAPCP